MTRLGFKQLTSDNWLEPEPLLDRLVHLSSDGHVRHISREEWAQRILLPQLVETVPAEIQDLFEVARGAMMYGYFFYPLYTLATEQLYRVVEAAVSYKYELAGGPKQLLNSQTKKTKFPVFVDKIDWLFNAGVLTDTSDVQRQQAIAWFREFIPDVDEAAIQVIGIRSEKRVWHSIRHLRNHASHPSRQTIRAPVDAIRTLGDVVERINLLFGGMGGTLP